jgi:hypothetical protein
MYHYLVMSGPHIYFLQNGTNHLSDGNHWTHFRFSLTRDNAGLNLIAYSYGKFQLISEWTWNDANIPTLLWALFSLEIFKYQYTYFIKLFQWKLFCSNSFGHKILFAKSNQRNAAIRLPIYGLMRQTPLKKTDVMNHFSTFLAPPDLTSNNEMKRKYTHRIGGKFCVEIEWNERSSNDSHAVFEVRNLVSGRVSRLLNTQIENRATYQIDHLDVSEYDITVRFNKRQPLYINLCQGKYVNSFCVITA